MALAQHQHMSAIGFKSIQLLKDQTLGIGSYGSVCKALCDDLLCAAKIIHPTLIDPNAQQQIERQKEHRLPISRFMQECEFMSAIKHPNIVQFLGTHQDPQTGLPVLLMELMDDSLTHFLESSPNAVPYHIQVNFTNDITLAIAYLHSNGVTHRDLSSNNVLLCGNVKAKITDFGMAKLGNINFHATHVSLTQCPGTDVYMPPEAVKEKPTYTKKIDCFSVGVLIIQILTRCFPDPGDRHKTIQIDHPKYPGGMVDVRVSEIERRKNHIDLVDPNHPLLTIALHCLKDSHVERPSAQELCRQVGGLKERAEYRESVGRVHERAEPAGNEAEREGEISELRQQIQDKDEEISQLRQALRDKDELLRVREMELEQLILVAKSCNSSRSDPCICSGDSSVHETKASDTQIRKTFKLSWIEGQTAPLKLARGPNAIVDGDTVYLRAGGTRDIHAYKSTDDKWEHLPECETEVCSMAIVNNLLTTIGGKDREGRVTNQLFSLTRSKKWEEVFQPMPTKRSSSVAVCIGLALIVAGGWDQEEKKLKTVEIMEVATQEWSSAADLPEPLCEATATICYNHLYILGSIRASGGSSYSVQTCALNNLFLSCRSKVLGERLALPHSTGTLSSPPIHRSAVWEKVADLPVTASTCVTLHGQLLAIGGYASRFMPTSEVRMYHPSSDTWEVIGKMKMNRFCCYAAVVRDNKLIVVGGYTAKSGNETDSVEIATIT